MEFLAAVLHVELHKCDVHDGFTEQAILDFMKKPIEDAKNAGLAGTEPKQGEPDMREKKKIWVFLDEINTSGLPRNKK